ncbi:hypothetical protein VTN00DRAFT_8807 [Thermoascus crustaceus]|uniref:uncharacterized protein n=1 Tax=Thermoascus crustaceus TaxID=5088 RepID=UPI00374421A5
MRARGNWSPAAAPRITTPYLTYIQSAESTCTITASARLNINSRPALSLSKALMTGPGKLEPRQVVSSPTWLRGSFIGARTGSRGQ